MRHLLRRAARNSTLDSALRPVVEWLEQRQLLSVSFNDGTLTIAGTAAADTIVLAPSGRFPGHLRLQLNGATKFLDQDAVKAIKVDSSAGNDYVSIQGNISIPVTVRGAAGNDTIAGAFGNDLVNGGAGSDLLCGNDGNDTVIGGPGNDRILGGEGDDLLYGCSGHDAISTGPVANVGKDTVDGGTGENTVNNQQRPNFPIYSFTGLPTGYGVHQMRRAYGFGEITDPAYTNRGKGQAIAIIDAFNTTTAKRDLATFSRQYGLPAPTKKSFRQVFASGHRPTTDQGWAGEALLDIEWAHAIAPAATIILVEADSALNPDISRAIDVAVKYLNKYFKGGVISMSLGGNEFPEQVVEDGSFRNRYTKNISFVASAGDTPLPSHPSSNPYVLSVGGTKLFLDAYGNRVSGDIIQTIDPLTGDPLVYHDSDVAPTPYPIEGGERPWFLAGSGPSSVYPEPIWQQNRGVNYPAPNLTTGTFIGPPYNRGTPDIAYNADPASGVAVYNSFGDSGFAGWFSVGGTSAGAPQIAGLVALANQARADRGLKKLGSSLVERIYRLGQSGPDAYFNDITQLGVYPQLYQPIPVPEPDNPILFLYKAYVGWDYASGWGSPNARSLIPALAEEKLPFTNGRCQLSGQFTTFDPLAPSVGGASLTAMQFKVTGTLTGLRTLNLYTDPRPGTTYVTPTPSSMQIFNAPAGSTTVISLFGFDDYGIATPGNPIILHRVGDSVVGQGKWQILTTPTGGTATYLRGFFRFDGRMYNRNRLEGNFYSITPNGRVIKNVFSRDPINPNLAVTYLKGSFKKS